MFQTNHVQRIHGFIDMRNRVVGARLMKDGILPYYYHWYPGEPLKYVVERETDTSKYVRVSLMTASPFFHRILAPIADLDESVIERGFFILCYLLLFAMFFVSWRQSNIIMTLLFFVPVLFMDAWWQHILQSQYYLIFGFFLFTISLCLFKKHYIIAGILLGILVLLRLNCIVFAFPFLLYFKRYKSFLLSTFICIALYSLLVLLLPFEKANWIQYFIAIKEHTAIHAGLISYPHPHYSMNNILPRVFEGQNLIGMDSIRAAEHFWVNPTAANFKSIYLQAFRKHVVPVALFQFLFLSVVVVFSLFIFMKNKKDNDNGADVSSLILTGFLFYFLSDFLSPIDNAPYQMIQWVAVVCLFLIKHKSVPKIAFILMLLGIIINNHYILVFPYKHMCSEFLFITSITIAILGRIKEEGRQLA